MRKVSGTVLKTVGANEKAAIYRLNQSSGTNHDTCTTPCLKGRQEKRHTMTTNEPQAEAKTKSRDGRRRNALTHGLRASTLGSVPAGASYVGKLLHEFRRQLEAVVMGAKGEISFTDACHVNTASRHEKHALLAGRWLKLHAATMTHDQRLAYSAAVGKASESRDRAIAALKLDCDSGSVLDQLYGPRITDVPAESEGGSDER